MTGQKECIPCPVGQYQNKTGQIICKDCPEGKYQDTTQATQCKTCTEGNWSEPGSDKCYVCTDDKPCGGGNNAECPLGYYKSVGSNQCTKCSDTYSNCLICSSENCIQCNVGFELKDNKCKAGCLIDFCEDCPNPSKCEKCKEGYYIQENGTCSNDFCVAPDFVKIQAGGISYCVTRRNMGDLITTNSNPSNIKLYDCSGHNCESKVCSCMSTSSDSNCNVAYANYSGCSRTVGNQKYGIEICKNFNYANKNWYLPSESELLNIFNVAIKDQKNSLQLCSSSNIGQYYPQCNCGRTWTNNSWDTCDSSGCRPWARSIYYYKGSVELGLEYRDDLNSVRCITKL